MILAAAAFALVTPVVPGAILTEAPAKPDPRARYVFYLHGRILETQGRHAVSPDFGPYEYDRILEALAARGLTVIGEVRKEVAGREFAERVAGQVRRLKAAGVPSRHISLVGASKGAGMTLQVAAALADPEMSYVVLAGCSVDDAAALRGRILSVYDADDSLQPSCARTFAKATRLTAREEIVVKRGLGHGLLYKPHAEWVDPAVAWIYGVKK